MILQSSLSELDSSPEPASCPDWTPSLAPYFNSVIGLDVAQIHSHFPWNWQNCVSTFVKCLRSLKHLYASCTLTFTHCAAHRKLHESWNIRVKTSSAHLLWPQTFHCSIVQKAPRLHHRHAFTPLCFFDHLTLDFCVQRFSTRTSLFVHSQPYGTPQQCCWLPLCHCDLCNHRRPTSPDHSRILRPGKVFASVFVRMRQRPISSDRELLGSAAASGVSASVQDVLQFRVSGQHSVLPHCRCRCLSRHRSLYLGDVPEFPG